MLVGYARVSTTDQTLDLQHDALTKAGCTKIFTDTVSGAQAERKGLTEALSYVRAGDTLVVWKLGDLKPGDVFLLCSDGLTRRVADEEIRTTLERFPPEAARRLLAMALERGATDNVTALVVGILIPHAVPVSRMENAAKTRIRPVIRSLWRRAVPRRG